MKTVKLLLNYLVFLGLLYTSIYSLKFILEIAFDLKIIFSLIVTSTAIYFLSKYFRQKNPKRFINGNLTPIYIVVSLSLSIFLLSFVFEEVGWKWQSFINTDLVFKEITRTTLTIILMLALPTAPAYLIWRFYSKDKGFLVNLFVALLLVLSYISILYLVASPESNISEVLNEYYNQFISSIAVPLFKLTVGVLPLGWFYELYIGTMLNEEVRKRLGA